MVGLPRSGDDGRQQIAMRKRHVALQGSSRDRPLHFAGRQTELTALAQRLRYIRETSAVSGGMVLIDGVQGVGKTQLVNEFARQATFADRAVSWLGLTTHELDASAESLFLRLLAKIGKAADAGRIADTVGKVTGAAVAGVRISPDSASRQDQTLSQMLQQSADMGLWNRRSLLLTVDEIQNITADGRRTLRELHEGWHRCPIMVVGAGLQHSLQQLSGTLPRPDGTTDTATISRFAKRLTLAPLGRDETVEAVREGLAALGHDVEEAAVSRLAEASMDFPQHIHGYIEGAADAIRRHGSLDPEIALREALSHGDAARVDYYEDRLSGMVRPELMVKLAAEMDAMADRSLPWNRALKALDEYSDGQGESVLADAIAHGVLTKGLLRQLSFGIPSFHDHMMYLYRREQRL